MAFPNYPVGLGSGSSLLSGLIAAWNLDEASGGPYLDSGPNGLHLTTHNTPTQVSGLLGNATNFTRATPDYLTVSSDLLRPANYSVFSGSAWFKGAVNIPGGEQWFITSIYDTASGGALREFFASIRDTGSGGFGRLIIVDPVATEQANQTHTDMDTSDWGLMYFSYDLAANSAYLRIKTLLGYDDNATLTSITDPPISAGEFAIGCNYDGLASLGFNGDLFGIYLWNRALTTAEQGFDSSSGGLWNGGTAIKYPF